jgi:hypothetical protein
LKWVSDLLDSDGKDWNYDKITGYFNVPDADAIAKIKHPSRRTNDILAWALEKNNRFIV